MVEEREQNAPVSRLAKLIAEVAARLAGTRVTELEIRRRGIRLRIRRSGRPATPAAWRRAAPLEEPATRANGEADIEITSPITGIFYNRPAASEPRFVEPGDRVGPGHVVGLVEAMKVFNEVVCHSAGIVVAVFLETGDEVREGQVVAVLRPFEAGEGTDGPAMGAV